MAKAIPYLNFKNTLEALEHYKEIFGDVLLDRAPMDKGYGEKLGMTEEEIENSTMHCVMNFGGSLIMASDDFSKKNNRPQDILLDFNSEDKKHMAKIKEIASNFEKVDGCITEMKLADQFWGGMMGIYFDKYGNKWLLHAQSYTKVSETSEIAKKYYLK